MARPKNIPMDVYKEMLESGIKFDESGNVVEDDIASLFLTPKSSVEDSEDQDDTSAEDIEEDEADDSTEEDVDHGDSEDESDDEVDLGVNKPSAAKDVKPKLTPKVEKKAEDDVIAEMRKKQEALERRIEELSRPVEKVKVDTSDDSDDMSDVRFQVEELKREAEEFRKDRLRRFADNVKSSVDQRNFGATFKEIIASSEWDAYLSSTTLGASVGVLYVNAIEKQDTDSVVSFFDEFAKRYLVSNDKIAEPKAKARKPSLEDLAVPEKTKTTKPVRSSKYDFEENDYAQKLNQFERGRITHSDFMKFDQAFDKALRAGRVKPSN